MQIRARREGSGDRFATMSRGITASPGRPAHASCRHSRSHGAGRIGDAPSRARSTYGVHGARTERTGCAARVPRHTLAAAVRIRAVSHDSFPITRCASPKTHDP